MTASNSNTGKPMPKTKRRSLKIIMTDQQWDNLQRRAAEIGIPVSRLVGMVMRSWLKGEVTIEV